MEEFFFRGFMFGVFVRRMPLVWAALLDGVVFGLGHAPAAPIQLIALGAFGVGLCLLYLANTVHHSVHGPPRPQ